MSLPSHSAGEGGIAADGGEIGRRGIGLHSIHVRLECPSVVTAIVQCVRPFQKRARRRLKLRSFPRLCAQAGTRVLIPYANELAVADYCVIVGGGQGSALIPRSCIEHPIFARADQSVALPVAGDVVAELGAPPVGLLNVRRGVGEKDFSEISDRLRLRICAVFSPVEFDEHAECFHRPFRPRCGEITAAFLWRHTLNLCDLLARKGFRCGLHFLSTRHERCAERVDPDATEGARHLGPGFNVDGIGGKIVRVCLHAPAFLANFPSDPALMI